MELKTDFFNLAGLITLCMVFYIASACVLNDVMRVLHDCTQDVCSFGGTDVVMVSCFFFMERIQRSSL
jgi:hypothetical protein